MGYREFIDRRFRRFDRSIDRKLPNISVQTRPEKQNIFFQKSTPTMSERERKKLASRLQLLLQRFYQVHDENGANVSNTFHRLPLRTGTDYYKVVLNPLSLHAIGRKIKKFQYDNAQQFVDDLALVSWNARLYNRKDSVFYTHALILKNYILKLVLPKLKVDKSVNHGKTLSYPNLGDLPDEKDDPVIQDNIFYTEDASAVPDLGDLSNSPAPLPIYQHHQSAHQQQQFQQEQFTPLKFQLHTPTMPSHTPTPYKNAPTIVPSSNNISHKSHRAPKAESGIKRGRPPIIDKPFETRIKLILKNFKKLRDPNNELRLLTQHFERLPDVKMHPDYYNKISFPISLNEIKIKVRTRKYTNVEQFIHDLDVMFSNSQMYYESDPYSEEYIDFVNFNKEAQQIIQTELSKSDRELIGQTTSGSDGVIRYPMDSLTVNGHLYKIGDWVLIQNPSDPDKPTVGQIFRLWSTEDGNRYTNVCWYYRPEQTCHKEDRLFYKNEVCKTGQYRDHLVDEIVGPCYVVFLTRYQKGDLPDGITDEGNPWFICEFRYNHLSHVFNRIRTWKACLPDEVRDNFELPLIPLSEPRKLIKYESPVRPFLPKDAYIGMAIPDPTEGSQPNCPPLMGLCYLGNPVPDDDLGQFISSPNVVPVPEHDDHTTGRRAYLFTPISQLKGGGISNQIYSNNQSTHVTSHAHTTLHALSAPPMETMNVNTGMNKFINSSMPGSQAGFQGMDDRAGSSVNTFLPNSYKLLQAQIQETNHKRQQEQELLQFQQQQHQQLFKRPTGLSASTADILVPEGTNYHKTNQSYLTLLAGGVLSYTLDETSGLLEVSDALNKKRKIESGEQEAVFYRAPPILTSGKVLNNVGPSAKYLAWKAKQDVKT